jgi:hypothetical protein
MSTSLEREPTTFSAGDTVAWTRSLADYPASAGWALNYRFIRADSRFDVVSSASGDDHVMAISAAVSAAFTTGTYTWVAAAVRGSERYTVADGTCRVEVNLPAAGAGYDDRSPARKALDALNAGLERFGNNAHVHAYSVEGRSLTYRTFSEFIAARDRLAQEVAREDAGQRARAGLPSRNRVRVQWRSGQ